MSEVRVLDISKFTWKGRDCEEKVEMKRSKGEEIEETEWIRYKEVRWNLISKERRMRWENFEN